MTRTNLSPITIVLIDCQCLTHYDEECRRFNKRNNGTCLIMKGSIRLTKTKGSEVVTRKTKKRPSSSRLAKIIPQQQPTFSAARLVSTITNHQLYHVDIKRHRKIDTRLIHLYVAIFVSHVTEGYGILIISRPTQGSVDNSLLNFFV